MKRPGNNDLVMVFTSNWIWIRFNPDSNRDKTPFKTKLECLKKIEKHIKRIPRNSRSTSYFTNC